MKPKLEFVDKVHHNLQSGDQVVHDNSMATVVFVYPDDPHLSVRIKCNTRKPVSIWVSPEDLSTKEQYDQYLESLSNEWERRYDELQAMPPLQRLREKLLDETKESRISVDMIICWIDEIIEQENLSEKEKNEAQN